MLSLAMMPIIPFHSQEELWACLEQQIDLPEPQAAMAALDPSTDGIKFADFDLTLTDRDLDDFLSFMERQTNGDYADAMPQLPDVAMDFPGLQLQPHSGSPSRSEDSDSAGTSGAAGTAPNSARLHALAPSDGSLTSAAMSSPARDQAGAGSSGTTPQQFKQQHLSAGSSHMDVSSQQLQQPQPLQLPQQLLPPLQPVPIKGEKGSPLLGQQRQQQVQFTAVSSLPAVLAMSAGSAAASGNTLAGTLLGRGDSTNLMASCPNTLDMGQQGFLQPMQWHSSSAVAALTAPAGPTQQQQGQAQPLPQLLFVQGAGMPALQQQPAQQLGLMPPAGAGMNQQIAAFAGLASPTGDPSCSTAMERQASGSGSGNSRASRQLQQLQLQPHQPRVSHDANGGKPQISHSTVEKQRRDRLNSLIDDLSDMVPPADPKYGCDTNSVRRPKHVVLADTINLLKAMQTKLQIEEAEICTLKQHAAAVGAIAASHQAGHAAVPEAADAMMQAAAAGCTSPEHMGYGDAGGGMPVELPTAPESGANSTGVLVEQGIGCLYVKVNCKDRKGLLSDVVSALKAFPVVICTAAITTTKDGKVHDVFEVSYRQLPHAIASVVDMLAPVDWTNALNIQPCRRKCLAATASASRGGRHLVTDANPIGWLATVAPKPLPVLTCLLPAAVCLQVRIEDPSVTAEDIQCAVQQALFAAAAARSKRLRREDSVGTMQG